MRGNGESDEQRYAKEACVYALSLAAELHCPDGKMNMLEVNDAEVKLMGGGITKGCVVLALGGVSDLVAETIKQLGENIRNGLKGTMAMGPTVSSADYPGAEREPALAYFTRCAADGESIRAPIMTSGGDWSGFLALESGGDSEAFKDWVQMFDRVQAKVGSKGLASFMAAMNSAFNHHVVPELDKAAADEDAIAPKPSEN